MNLALIQQVLADQKKMVTEKERGVKRICDITGHWGTKKLIL
jgi:hypothetical protein